MSNNVARSFYYRSAAVDENEKIRIGLKVLRNEDESRRLFDGRVDGNRQAAESATSLQQLVTVCVCEKHKISGKKKKNIICIMSWKSSQIVKVGMNLCDKMTKRKLTQCQ